MKPVILFIILYFLSSCAVVPKVSQDPDNERCKLSTNKMELDIIGSTNCTKTGDPKEVVGCLALAAGAMTVTGIISGSIVLSGNTIHWIEKQGKCEDSALNTYVMKHNKVLQDNNGVQINTEDNLNSQITK